MAGNPRRLTLRRKIQHDRHPTQGWPFRHWNKVSRVFQETMPIYISRPLRCWLLRQEAVCLTSKRLWL